MRSGDDVAVEEATEPGHADELLWFGWQRRTWMLLAFLALALSQILGFVIDSRQDAAQDKRDRQEQEEEAAAQAAQDRRDAAEEARRQQEETDDDYLACLRGNQSRQVLRLVVTRAYEPGAASFDVTKLPEWQAVARDTPSTAALILVLTTPREGGSVRAEEVLALIPEDLDCAASFPTHTPGIEQRAGLEAPPGG